MDQKIKSPSEVIRAYYAETAARSNEPVKHVASSGSQNVWIADRGYGSGMALAFQGDPEFIRQSVNFAVNFLLSATSQIKEQTPSFAIVNTTMEDLTNALISEGSLRRMLELRKEHRKNHGSEFDLLEEDDYPLDYDEQNAAYIWAVLAAQTPEEVVKAEELNIMSNIDKDDPVLLAKWEKDARAYGEKYAQEEIAKLRFEDFMRGVSRAPVASHTLIDGASFSS
jgi:hypothetical protein